MTSERALVTLEFPAVRALLAERTAFPPGRELAETLVPARSLEEAERLQDETAAGRSLIRAVPSAGLTGARDIRQALRRAALGGGLDPEQLLEVGQTIRAAERLFADVHPYPPLAARTRFAPPPLALAATLEQAIGADATVLDRASPALGGLRAAVRGAQSRLQQRVDGILRSTEVARFLQDPIVTQRGGRYVVPVKAEYRGAVRGIVHDQSASGQTVFIEPLEVLEANNALREAELAERTEVARILDALSRRVEQVGEELRTVLEALAAVDLILAKSSLAEAEDAERPRLNAVGVVDLIGARHPLLVARGSVVPVDVRLGTDFRILVVTGPNTGGKTVTLKTIGLLTLMASSGLQVPAAAGSQLPVIKRIFADIGDEQSIAQSLSTFSSHLRNVVSTLADARAGDLAFLDELGAGTDPDQGAALAMAVLETLLARGVLVAATTHYPELKAFALNTPGVTNASVEFDAATLRPTYRVRVGLPGASQAFAIAAHLGLDAEVLALAEGHLSELHRSLERTLREAERQRTALASSLEEQRVAAADAHSVTAAATVEAEGLLEEARAALRHARAEADEVILGARRALRSAEEARERPGRRDLVDEARAAVIAFADAARKAPTPRATPPRSSPLVVGQRVTVAGTTEPGTLLSIDDAGLAEIAVGAFRVRAAVGELRGLATEALQPLPSARVTRTSATPPPLQLDIRGARADEALAELERYLNDAALSGYDRIRVVHGKGTGALRLAVRAALGAHPLVRGYESAGPSEGGDGATIVSL